MEASEEYNLFMQIAAIGKINSTEKSTLTIEFLKIH